MMTVGDIYMNQCKINSTYIGGAVCIANQRGNMSLLAGETLKL
jgi:hypothetical protein